MTLKSQRKYLIISKDKHCFGRSNLLIRTLEKDIIVHFLQNRDVDYRRDDSFVCTFLKDNNKMIRVVNLKDMNKRKTIHRNIKDTVVTDE